MGLTLIVGKGDLSQAVHKKIPYSVIVGRPEYDLSQKADCDKLIQDYFPDVVINTVAVNETHSCWDILSTNYVSSVYLTMEWLKKLEQGHIINISSTSTYWTSWPGMIDGRLCYNISKEALSLFGKHVNRKIVDSHQITVSTIELGAFKSKFNNYTGSMPLERAADIVVDCVNNPMTQISCIK